MFNPRQGLMNKLMRLVESWNEEPVGIQVVTPGVEDIATQRKCMQVLMKHTPQCENNSITDRLVPEEDTHYSFVRISQPRHLNVTTDIAKKIRHDCKELGLEAETTLVHDELDAKVLEWSTGLTCDYYDFYSFTDLTSHLPTRPSGYVSIDGLVWEDGQWAVADLSNGAGDTKQLWKLLRNHLFSTNQATIVASFDWMS